MRKEKFWEMKEEKNRHTVWLTDNAWELVAERYQKDNCSTKNEYIEKAIRFYSGYLDSERAEEYLPRVLAQVLEGKLDAFGKRIGRQTVSYTHLDVYKRQTRNCTDGEVHSAESCPVRALRTRAKKGQSAVPPCALSLIHI